MDVQLLNIQTTQIHISRPPYYKSTRHQVFNESCNPDTLKDGYKNCRFFADGEQMALSSQCHWWVEHEPRKKECTDSDQSQKISFRLQLLRCHSVQMLWQFTSFCFSSWECSAWKAWFMLSCIFICPIWNSDCSADLNSYFQLELFKLICDYTFKMSQILADFFIS